MVKAIFIDFYKTLCFGKFWTGLEPDVFAKIQALIFESDNTLINEWMVGKYTAEQINHIISEKLSLDYTILWNSFLRGCELMRADQKSLDLIKRLQARFQFILVTDNMDSFDRFIRQRMMLDTYFDKIYSSYNTKLLKSDRGAQIFKNVMQEYNLKPRECVLIDDSVRVCDIFTRLGGISYTVTEQTPLSYWLAELENSDAQPRAPSAHA